MAFQVSPGVQIKEIDLTSIIPAVSTTRAGFAGEFSWGPVDQIITITSQNNLRETFSDPNNTNYVSWWSAANFLAYSNNLQVVRVINGALNAANSGTGVLIKNQDDYDTKDAAGSLGSNIFIAKYAGGVSGDLDGTLGNSIKVSAFNRTTTDIELQRFGTYGLTGGANPNLASGAAADNSPSASEALFYASSLTPVADGFTNGVDLEYTNTGTTMGDLLTLTGGLNARTVTGFTAGRVGGISSAAVSLASGATKANIIVKQFTGDGTKGTITADNQSIGRKVKVNLVFGATTGVFTSTIVGVSGAADAATLGITIDFDGGPLGTTASIAAGSTVELMSIIAVGSTVESQSGVTGAAVRAKYADSFTTSVPATSQSTIDKGGTNDLINVAVVDHAGYWSGNREEVLEVFDGVSVSPNAKDFAGNSIYYKDVINAQSNYVWFGDQVTNTGKGGVLATRDNTGVAGAAFGANAGQGSNYGLLTRPVTVLLSGGTSGAAVSDFVTNGYEKFSDTETVDVNILVGGGITGNNASSVANIASDRKDAIAFFSPPQDAILDSTGAAPLTQVQSTANAVAYRKGTNGNFNGGSKDYTSGNLNINNSYAVLDSGWKYIYDRYNDTFRFVPLNADTAGVTVRTDIIAEPWFSPAGFNRGQIRDVVKLAYSPVKTQRDDLYQAQVNPIVSFPGQGTVLFGDKTMQSSPSAFDRINVRRLFIILEKAIATAAKFQLFEVNDAFTRAQFRGLIEPFLRDVQARRGITDFRVICDESNNTSTVIDRNEFVASIFVKPTRSINFITLNFIASASGVNFDEIGG